MNGLGQQDRRLVTQLKRIRFPVMKRIGGIWKYLYRFENLLLAYQKARRGKTKRSDVAFFSMNLEQELLSLQEELFNGRYQPGQYRIFTIYERKPRTIAAAPFRDRVVHHAVLNQLEPQIDRTFIFDSYTSRGHGCGFYNELIFVDSKALK